MSLPGASILQAATAGVPGTALGRYSSNQRFVDILTFETNIYFALQENLVMQKRSKRDGSTPAISLEPLVNESF